MSTKNVLSTNIVYDLLNAGLLTYSEAPAPAPAPAPGSAYTLFAWGSDTSGQLGRNSATSGTCYFSSPVQIPGTTWTAISASTNASFALRSDNTLWSWGANYAGGLGINDGINPSINRSSPVQIPGTTWCCINAGYSTIYGMKTGGQLFAWGGQYGTGQGDSINRSSPTQIPGNWLQIEGDSIHAGGIKSDCTMWAWGSNASGRLGLGVATDNLSPEQIPGSWCLLKKGGGSNLAFKTDGTMWSWGYNSGGELGVNDVVPRSSPIQIPGTWCCPGPNWFMNSAIKVTDSCMYVWGSNSTGSLGLNDNNPRSSPIVLPGSWCKLYRGTSYATFGKRTDATTWAWGSNFYGNLGIYTLVSYLSSPVQIPGTWGCIEGAMQGGHVLGLK